MSEALGGGEELTYSPRRIAANIGWLSVGNALSLALSAGYGIALARLMGPSLFGDYAYLSSLLALAAPLASFRLLMVLVREMSNRPRDRATLSGSALVLFFSYLWRPSYCCLPPHASSSRISGSTCRYASFRCH